MKTVSSKFPLAALRTISKVHIQNLTAYCLAYIHKHCKLGITVKSIQRHLKFREMKCSKGCSKQRLELTPRVISCLLSAVTGSHRSLFVDNSKPDNLIYFTTALCFPYFNRASFDLYSNKTNIRSLVYSSKMSHSTKRKLESHATCT